MSRAKKWYNQTSINWTFTWTNSLLLNTGRIYTKINFMEYNSIYLFNIPISTFPLYLHELLCNFAFPVRNGSFFYKIIDKIELHIFWCSINWIPSNSERETAIEMKSWYNRLTQIPLKFRIIWSCRHMSIWRNFSKTVKQFSWLVLELKSTVSVLNCDEIQYAAHSDCIKEIYVPWPWSLPTAQENKKFK